MGKEMFMQTVSNLFVAYYVEDDDAREEWLPDCEAALPPWFADACKLAAVKSAMSSIRFNRVGDYDEVRMPSVISGMAGSSGSDLLINERCHAGPATLFSILVSLGDTSVWLVAGLTGEDQYDSVEAWRDLIYEKNWMWPPNPDGAGRKGPRGSGTANDIPSSLEAVDYGPCVLEEYHSRIVQSMATQILIHGFAPMVEDWANFYPMLNSTWDWFRDFLQIHPDATV